MIGAVLAGGSARRIGGGKATVELHGRPLLHYPLAALRMALDQVVVVAGDMPFVSRDLVHTLTRRRMSGAVALVPRGAGRLQPLCARYEAAALSALAG